MRARQLIQTSIFDLAMLLSFVVPVHAGELHDYNSYDISIPDNCTSVSSDLLLNGAPVGAKITNVKLYAEIQHPRHSDLTIWVTFYDGGWRDLILYNQGSLSSSGLLPISRLSLHNWDGFSANQEWFLSVRDCQSGGSGSSYINIFELWVTYEVNAPPNAPSSPTPSDGAPNVSRTTDLSWSCADPNTGDVIRYTVYFEKNDATPDNILKNDATGATADPGTMDYDSHYYWQVKADDHNGGVTLGPIWDFYTEAAPIVDAEVTGVTFDKTEVKRGQETITATVSLRNTGNQDWTFYVGSSSIMQGDVTWYDWTPARAGKTLSPHESGSVTLSWSPTSSVSIGSYGLYSKIFKYSTGSEFVHEDWRDAAFQVVGAVLLSSGRVAFHRDSDNHSLHTPISADDGDVFICNLNDGVVPNQTAGLEIGNCMNPHFAPDGSALAFMAIPAGQALAWANMRVYVLDLAENTLTSPGVGQDPKFSADGRKIVYKKNEQVWQMDVDGSSDNALTTSTGEKSGPNYNPGIADGRIVYWKTYWVGPSRRGDIVLRLSGGAEQTLVYGTDSRYCYYPIWKDADNILYTMSEGADDLYHVSVSSGATVAFPPPINSPSDESDPFPVNALIGFSSTRSEGSGGGYDLYVATADASAIQELAQGNTSLHELGGSFSPYRHARKLKITAPGDDASIEPGSSYLLKVRAYSDGGVWSGASPSITMTGPLTQTYTGLKDDGTAGDQTPGDGIYSKTVTLPSTVGAYSVVAEAISSDNGISNSIVSRSVGVTLVCPPPSSAPTRVAASDDQCNQICVSWQWSGSGQTGFKVFRDGAPVHPGADPNERSWCDPITGTHSYYVDAYNDCGDGPASSPPDQGTGLTAPSSAPTSVAASDNLCDTIRASWEWSGSGQTGFKVFRDGSLTPIYTGTVPGERSWCDPITGTHSYYVKAYNACDDGPPSNTDPGTGLTAPTSAPTSVAASDNLCDTIRVNWQWFGSGQTGFKVFRDGSLTPIYTGTVPGERSWWELITGTHTYTVKAYNACGDGPASSPPDQGTGLTAPTSAPTSVAATDNLCDTIRVSWQWSGSGQAGFKVFRDGSGSPTATLADPGQRSWWELITGTHTYTVKAYNACGDGPASSPPDQGTGLTPPTSAPASVAASDNLCDTIRVSWQWSGSGQTGFKVFRDESLTPIYTGTVPSERTWWELITGPHTYTVKAYNACGDGPPSNTDPGTGLTTPTSAPTAVNLEGHVPTDSQYCIRWNRVSGALQYEIREDAGSWNTVGSDTQMCYRKPVPDSFSYVVRALNTCGAGLASDTVWVKVTPGSDVGDVPSSTRPHTYALSQNYPNPFNSGTEIRFALPASGRVTLTVYDVLGREITRLVDQDVESGVKSVSWDGRDANGRPVPSGVYFYRLSAGRYTESKKMVLLK